LKELDIVTELVDLGKRRGTLTYDEINDAFPPEFTSPEELEDFMGLLQDMGIEVIDNQELILEEEEGLDEEEEYGGTEDLVQTYFHSMGDISILTKNEEKELAKTLESGKGILKETVKTLPLYKKIEASLNGDEEEHLNGSQKELTKGLQNMEI
jgi:RNA polymerase primary sigma factor